MPCHAGAVGGGAGWAPLVLVHSPLVGPATCRPLAQELRRRGRRTVLPSLPGAPAAGAPVWRRQVDAVVSAVAREAAGEPLVLAAHSGAGPLLHLLDAALPAEVLGWVLVDAGLPGPGGSWVRTAPPALVEHLRSLVVDGWLPPWHEWFGGEEALAPDVPDAALRAALLAELRPLPWAALTEDRPSGQDRPGPPGAYLQLSGGYAQEAALAAARGWPVRVLDSHHLGLATDPAAVAGALLQLVDLLDR